MKYDIKELESLVKAKDINALKSFMKTHKLVVKNGKIVPRSEVIADFKTQAAFWHQRQQARKILLNSLYGALLNEGSLFNDKRLGQSVTLSGRCVTRHMASEVNQNITGIYDYKGEASQYCDTDSNYFSAYEILKANPDTAALVNDRDFMLDLYKNIGDNVNESFPPFMDRAFNTGLENGAIIAAGLELVGENAIFMKKKRYAILKYWDEDNGRLDIDGKPGKIKAIGLEVRRSDTPKYMQTFMEEILMDVLQGAGEAETIAKIRDFRFDVFRAREPWNKGSPKKVNGLTKYMEKLGLIGKKVTTLEAALNAKKTNNTVPGHVRAAINWNTLRNLNKDKQAVELTDGSNIIVCKLKRNQLNMTSVAFPYDELFLPDWFKSLPFDEDAMEEIIIDKKMDNLLGIMKWDLSKTKISKDFDELFG